MNLFSMGKKSLWGKEENTRPSTFSFSYNIFFLKHVKSCCLQKWINRFLEWSKFNEFANDKSNVAEKLKSCFRKG